MRGPRFPKPQNPKTPKPRTSLQIISNLNLLNITQLITSSYAYEQGHRRGFPSTGLRWTKTALLEYSGAKLGRRQLQVSYDSQRNRIARFTAVPPRRCRPGLLFKESTHISYLSRTFKDVHGGRWTETKQKQKQRWPFICYKNNCIEEERRGSVAGEAQIQKLRRT